MSEQPLLKPYQRRIAAGGLTALSGAAIGLVAFGVLWLLRLFVITFANVIWPLMAASILAVLMRPVVDVLATKVRLGRMGAVIVLYALVLIGLAVGVLLLVPVLISQTINLVELTPQLLDNARELLVSYYPDLAGQLGPEEGWGMLAGLLPEFEKGQDFVAASVPAIAQIQSAALRMLAVATGVAIVPVYLFFLLIDDAASKVDLKNHLSFLKPRWREDILFLIEEFAKAIVAFFRGQILIGLLMGALLAVGFYFAGLRFAVVFGLALGVLNIIPYLGTILGLATALPVAYLQPEGGPTLVLVTLGIFVVVQLIEGYLLTPRIMGDATGLHPMVIIVAIFFWGAALDGILGMVLAIPLTAFGFVAWQLLQKRYLTPLILGSSAVMETAAVVSDFNASRGAEAEPEPKPDET